MITVGVSYSIVPMSFIYKSRNELVKLFTKMYVMVFLIATGMKLAMYLRVMLFQKLYLKYHLNWQRWGHMQRSLRTSTQTNSSRT